MARGSKIMSREDMVVSLVVDLHASKNDDAGDDQSLALASGGVFRRGNVCFVGKTAENGNALRMDIPGIGDANLSAAEDAVDLDGSFVAFNFCVAKIELDSSKDGSGTAAFEVLALHAALATAKDGDGVEHIRRIRRTLRYGGGLHGAPHEDQPDSDNGERPEIGEMHVGYAKTV